MKGSDTLNVLCEGKKIENEKADLLSVLYHFTAILLRAWLSFIKKNLIKNSKSFEMP